MNGQEVTEAVIDFFGFYIPSGVAKLIFLASVVLAAIVATKIASRALKGVFERTDVPSASIFVNLVRAIIWMFALLVVLQPVFGIEPTAFVTALGVTSVALSLGLQDTISNVFGGLSLMTSKVIELGDVITISGVTGEVIDINWRSTIVREANNDVQIIPNSVLSKTALIKCASSQVGECQLPVTLVADANLKDVRADAEAAARKVLGDGYDDKFETSVFIQGFDHTGTLASISVHVKPGLSVGKARTAVAEELMRCSWLVRPASGRLHPHANEVGTGVHDEVGGEA